MSETNLRQANAKISVVGTLSDMNISISKDENNGQEMISGYLTIKTSEKNFARFNVKQYKYKKDQNKNFTQDLNSVYTGLVTVMNEYKPISKVGEEEATKVSVSGDVNLWTNSQTNEPQVGYKASFFNRYKGDDFENDKKAYFSIEMVIAQIADEFDKDGEETGRKIVKGWVPTFNGIEPVVLVGEADYVVQGLDEYEVGQTVMFDGDAINNSVKIVKKIPMKLGPAKEEVTYENRNELVITSASEPYEEGITPFPPYDINAIQLAKQERQNRLDAAKNAPKSSGSNGFTSKPSGAASGRTMNLGF